MGKWEEEPAPAAVAHPQPPAHPVHTCSCCARVCSFFRFRCLLVLLLGVSVLLSAVFWLPPFFSGGDHGDLDLDSRYKGHDIVATFLVQKPLSSLQDDLPRLGGDLFDELGGVPSTKVVILKAETTDESNTTKVIFGVVPDENSSKISSYAKSLVRDSFVLLVLHQSPLRLTESLFGEPSSFEVLKFVGGITVTPDQSAYPLQNVQIRFNFTLNFSIQQILDHFGELTSQLKSGLHLSPSENLHVSLTNAKGSTMAPQTTVQSSVVLAIGTPSTARTKQLAQTIKGSPTKNLGLNNTQFGRVKQISLSSYLNNSSGGSSAPTPSPAPLPHPPLQQPHHNHHHHHHHHHHHDKQIPPAKPPSPSPHPLAPSPAVAPAPHKIHNAKPPDCHSGYNRKKRNVKHPPLYPPVSQPALPPHISPPPLRRNHPPPPPPPPLLPPPPPPLSPPPPSLRPSPPPPPRHPLLSPPIPPPPPVSEIPASSPLPNVVLARTPPPSKSDPDADSPDLTPSGSFLQPSSARAACAGMSFRAIPTFLVAMTILKNIIPFN